MPKPKKGESREKYLQRAIPEMIKNEGVSQHYATGKAIGMYKYYSKKQKKK